MSTEQSEWLTHGWMDIVWTMCLICWCNVHEQMDVRCVDSTFPSSVSLLLSVLFISFIFGHDYVFSAWELFSFVPINFILWINFILNCFPLFKQRIYICIHIYVTHIITTMDKTARILDACKTFAKTKTKTNTVCIWIGSKRLIFYANYVSH